MRTALGQNVLAIVKIGGIRSETVEALAVAHDISVLVKPFQLMIFFGRSGNFIAQMND